MLTNSDQWGIKLFAVLNVGGISQSLLADTVDKEILMDYWDEFLYRGLDRRMWAKALLLFTSTNLLLVLAFKHSIHELPLQLRIYTLLSARFTPHRSSIPHTVTEGHPYNEVDMWAFTCNRTVVTHSHCCSKAHTELPSSYQDPYHVKGSQTSLIPQIECLADNSR